MAPDPGGVAEVRGRIEPERFELVDGHVDSWHVGIGDNATGDATLLEVARAVQAHRDQLARSVRIAWWSGHSHGRYAGSAWYAEAFALDLERNCICHVNCDSPCCRDADAYEGVHWMAELSDFARAAIEDLTGRPGAGTPPIRGGDISFNNLGVSTFFMLSSHMSPAELAKRGYYPVGGCGGNLEWHHEGDTIEVADATVLPRDMRLYAGSVVRAVNRTLHPLDFRATHVQIDALVGGYAQRLDGFVDLTSTGVMLRDAAAELERFYADAAAGRRALLARRPLPPRPGRLRAAAARVRARRVGARQGARPGAAHRAGAGAQPSRGRPHGCRRAQRRRARQGE
jgi:N-acetylated-alpha-linked acidic dipeptidase